MSDTAAAAQGDDAEKQGYARTNDWFEQIAKATWDTLLPQIRPRRFLEIGSFEGASACYLVDTFAKEADIELHCIDTWEGGMEHQGMMGPVELYFRHNIALAMKNAPHKVDLVVHKGYSDTCLAKLLCEKGKGYFDFVYVDGSHQAEDVLCDAVLGFRLLKVGGLLAFDDYYWFPEANPPDRNLLHAPKPAIDAFTNLYCRHLNFIPAACGQFYVQKLSD